MKNSKFLFSVLIILSIIVLSIFLIQKLTTVDNQKSNITKTPQTNKENTILQEIPFKSISKKYSGGYNKKGYHKINNQQEWSDLWQVTFSTSFPQPSLPLIDFNKEMVIAVFAGEFSSGGYSIEIIKLEEAFQVINVTIRNASPGSKCGTTSALTQPFHIIKTKKINKEIEFNEITKINNCN